MRQRKRMKNILKKNLKKIYQKIIIKMEPQMKNLDIWHSISNQFLQIQEQLVKRNRDQCQLFTIYHNLEPIKQIKVNRVLIPQEPSIMVYHPQPVFWIQEMHRIFQPQSSRTLLPSMPNYRVMVKWQTNFLHNTIYLVNPS